MTKTRTVVASSLSLCTTASMLAGGQAQAARSDDWNRTRAPDWEKKQVAQDVLYQYLNPISSVTEGNLAVKTEKKPLLYTVKKGDTLYGIGRRYGVGHEELARYNRIRDPRRIQAGQKLKIPVEVKRIRVKEGQTLTSIARRYQVSVPSLKRANPALSLTDALYVGQVLEVPRVFRPDTNHQPRPVKNRVQAASRAKDSPSLRSLSFRWPVTGQITSGYGWRHGKMHTGIDIWNPAREQSVIRASLGGNVVKAGYSGNYGNLVVVDHGNGWSTWYAHLSRISVAKGQAVAQASALGYMGTTGNSTGVHLHFEVRRRDRPLNPLAHLP